MTSNLLRELAWLFEIEGERIKKKNEAEARRLLGISKQIEDRAREKRYEELEILLGEL